MQDLGSGPTMAKAKTIVFYKSSGLPVPSTTMKESCLIQSKLKQVSKMEVRMTIDTCVCGVSNTFNIALKYSKLMKMRAA